MPNFYFGGSLFGGLKPTIQSFEWCDGIYSHGHKCSDYSSVLGNAKEGITKYDSCSENQPRDALQVYDESPKRNMHIKSDEWLNEGQGKLLRGPKVVSCERLGGLNHPNRSLEKSTSSTRDNLISTA